MSVKPILFSAEMVRAILDGRKTVTRRAIKPQPGEKLAYIWGGSNHGKWSFSPYNESHYEEHRAANDWKYWTPPCHTDDVLWVRETWNRGYIDSSDAELSNESWFEEYHKRDGSFLDGISGYVYRADFTRAEEYELGTLDEDNTPKPMPWRPSIHMPREAARIWLRVTNVRVERLQDSFTKHGGTIFEIRAEGINIPEECRDCIDAYGSPCCIDTTEDDGSECGMLDYPRSDFADLWDSTIKPVDRDRYGWTANPFCWVIEFEKCKKPEEG